MMVQPDKSSGKVVQTAAEFRGRRARASPAAADLVHQYRVHVHSKWTAQVALTHVGCSESVLYSLLIYLFLLRGSESKMKLFKFTTIVNFDVTVLVQAEQ